MRSGLTVSCLLAACLLAAAPACVELSSLDEHAIGEVERAHRREIVEQCWLPASHDHPEIQDLALPLSFSVSPAGRTADVTVEGAGIPPSLAECVRAQAREWQFPVTDLGAPRMKRTLYLQARPDLPPSLTW